MNMYYLHCRSDARTAMHGMWVRQSVNGDSEISAENDFSIELLMYLTCVINCMALVVHCKRDAQCPHKVTLRWSHVTIVVEEKQ
jgi:hypothetical protein